MWSAGLAKCYTVTAAFGRASPMACKGGVLVGRPFSAQGFRHVQSCIPACSCQCQCLPIPSMLYAAAVVHRLCQQDPALPSKQGHILAISITSPILKPSLANPSSSPVHYLLVLKQNFALDLMYQLCGARYFTERLVKACAELPKMCQFFHIPFQSGDDDILRRMRCASYSLRPECQSWSRCVVPRANALEGTAAPAGHTWRGGS